MQPMMGLSRRRAHEVGTMGRYLKGPFPLGSVLCTYERHLEIQYNTIYATPNKSCPLNEYVSLLSTLSISEQEGGTLLIMKDRSKIVVPKPARSKIIAVLYQAHSGISKTYATARQLYYWPHMKKNKEKAIAACHLCQTDRQTQE